MNSPFGVSSVKQCSYSPREGYGPSAAMFCPPASSFVCAYQVRGDPYTSGGTQRSICQRFTAGYFGSFLSSMRSRSNTLQTSRQSTRGGSSPTQRDSSVRQNDSVRRQVRVSAPRFPVSHASREGPESLYSWREVNSLHDKFVLAAIEHEVGNFRRRALNNRGIFASRRRTAENRSRLHVAGTRVELHTDVRGNQRAEISDIPLAVHSKKNQNHGFLLSASCCCAAKQQKDSRGDNSLHELLFVRCAGKV